MLRTVRLASHADMWALVSLSSSCNSSRLPMLTCTDCAYGLRYVTFNSGLSEKCWSLRQTAIYHKYRVSSKSSTWVMISPSRRAELALEQYFRDYKALDELNPFEILLLLLEAALATLRPFIIPLTRRVSKKVCTYLFHHRNCNNLNISSRTM